MVALQLVAEQHLQDSYDRRMRLHDPAPVRIRGRRLDHSLPARRQPCVELNLEDWSVDGLSATSDSPLMWGERLVVQLPGRHGLPAWTAMGRVVRCNPNSDGYDLDVEFETLPAA